MKIIHIGLGKANPERMNGVNKVIYQLATNQMHWCEDVNFWGITPTPKAATNEKSFKTKYFQYHKGLHKLDEQLINAIKQCNVNQTVFHLHGAFIPEFYRIAKLLNNLGFDYVYTTHGSFNEVSMQKNKWVKLIYLNLFEKNILKNAKAVQFLGKSEFDNIDNFIKLNNKVLVPNGQSFDFPEFSKMKKVDKFPIFGFCGRLKTNYKGLDLMLSGFADFLGNGNQAQLWLIGDGEDRKSLEKQCADLGITNNVIFCGAQYGADKFSMLNQLDYFLHTSRSEGLPTAVLEAAALGIPCIVSKASNMAEYVDKYNAGIALSKNTPCEISKAFALANQQIKSGKHIKLGANAIKMVQTDFDWVKIGKKLIEVYAA